MFKHCKPYIYYIRQQARAVSMTLLFSMCLLFGAVAANSSVGRIALLGDSMTWIGGDSCQNATGWSHILKESGLADTICVYARSGATWTNTPLTCPDTSFYSEILHDNNVVYNQALRLINRISENNEPSPDCIIIFAGANDAWFSSHRPAIFDDVSKPHNFIYPQDTNVSEVTSLRSSVELVCDILQASFPSAHYLVITPLQMSKVPAEKTFRVSDIIEKAASSRGCTVLRADKNVNITHETESKKNKYTYDGVHTNPDGAYLVGSYIISHIPSSNKQ